MIKTPIYGFACFVIGYVLASVIAAYPGDAAVAALVSVPIGSLVVVAGSFVGTA